MGSASPSISRRKELARLPVQNMHDQNRRRWRIKETVFSSWVDLPHEHTPVEIWDMKQRGLFVIAMLIEDSGVRNEPSSPATD
jgi:hypothetical protein